MVIFGTRGKVLQGHVVEGITCPNCHQSSHAVFGVLRYFHLFWIPTIPTTREAGMQCLHCKKTSVEHELPPEIRHQIKEKLLGVKKIFPMFSGLFLIITAIGWFSWQAKQTEIAETEFLASPLVGDIYVIDINDWVDDMNSDHPYGVAKIISISPDSFELVISTSGYNKASGPSGDIRNGSVDDFDYFMDESLFLTSDDLEAIKAKGGIVSVERKEG